jgi:hypothetical protein
MSLFCIFSAAHKYILLAMLQLYLAVEIRAKGPGCSDPRKFLSQKAGIRRISCEALESFTRSCHEPFFSIDYSDAYTQALASFGCRKCQKSSL